jgi:hypothetical protein
MKFMRILDEFSKNLCKYFRRRFLVKAEAPNTKFSKVLILQERKEENDYFRKSKEYQSLPDFSHY